VDLNRNHAAFWGFDDLGSSPQSASEVYRGPSAGSEPETAALEAFHRAHPPATAISFHSYAGTILYPWAHATGALTGDDAVFRALAGTDLAPAIADGLPGAVRPAYGAGPGWRLYPTNGDYTSWAYRRFGTLAVTVELTAGCCVAGQWYGFEFPDDDAMLAQLARDQRPFVRALLQAAGDPVGLVTAVAPAPAGASFESVWPEVRVLLPQGTMGTLEIAAADGTVQAAALQRDSLGVGRRSVRYVARENALLGSRGVRVAAARLVAEVVLRDGGESSATGWIGFGAAASPPIEGLRAWAAFADTLWSPPADIAGRSGLTLYYWTQHAGSLNAARARGLVQVAADDGPWVTVDEVRGAASAWYPRAVPLPPVEGAARLRVRFVADSLWWLLDAVTVAAADPRLFGAAVRTAAADPIAVSANPVRGDQVTLHWPAGTGVARVEIFSLTGTRVAEASFASDPGRWVWDLTVGAGQRAANGAYAVVVTREDGTRLRRRLLVAR
jgi:hypothetical protein